MTADIGRLTSALVDRYRIERELGGGGMSRVFVATETELDREVVIKVLSPELAEGLSADRFTREIRVVARLQHPNIVPLLSAGASDGLPWYTMPFVRGDSLRARLVDGAIDQRSALRVIADVLRALGHAHSAGILHRDIKPENILLSEGVAVVTDFGIARAISAARGGVDRPEVPSGPRDLPAGTLTQLGTSLGTPGYMAPEQIAGDADIGARADLYALGVVAYELLAGRHPFAERRGAQQMFVAHLTETPVALAARVPSIAPNVSTIIMQCLEKDPSARPLSAAAVLDALDTSPGVVTERTPPPEHDSGAIRADSGFWIAVLPFRYRGPSGDLVALAESMSEEIVTGLSRFSYLRIIAHSSTMRFTNETADVRDVGRALGAHYLIEGTLRQSGSSLRVAVQLVDASTGAHLWAETYNRAFDPDDAFALQDDLVPRIVATVANGHGVLLRTMSEGLRMRRVGEFDPFEAALRGTAYYTRTTPEEHAEVRDILERVVEQAPNSSTCWAMLAMLYIDEYRNAFNVRPNARGRAMAAARRAVEAGPTDALAWHSLASIQFHCGELEAFRPNAERAVALNPFDTDTLAFMGTITAYAGDWERGCAQVARARALNPTFPGWYWFADVLNAYLKGDYRAALDAGLRVNMPGYYWSILLLAAAYGQLGDAEGSRRSLSALTALVPDIAATARDEVRKWWDENRAEHLIDGLRKAGLPIADVSRATAGDR